MSYPNYRLVSLREMLEYSAANFHSVTTSLALLEGRLGAVPDLSVSVQDWMVEAAEIVWGERVKELRQQLEDLGCPISAMETKRLEDNLSSDFIKYLTVRDIANALKGIRGRLSDELMGVNFFAIEPSKVRHFKPMQPLMGNEVATKFPSLDYDIEEIGKCLSLSRSTAAVFHSLRSLEVGISAMSRCLGIPDPTKGAERNWGSMLAKIEKAANLKWPTAADKFAGDGATFEALHAVLVALRNPYRNATMHFDQKYTEDEAVHILAMVTGVMAKIASRMNEDGLPLVP